MGRHHGRGSGDAAKAEFDLTVRAEGIEGLPAVPRVVGDRAVFPDVRDAVGVLVPDSPRGDPTIVCVAVDLYGG